MLRTHGVWVGLVLLLAGCGGGSDTGAQGGIASGTSPPPPAIAIAYPLAQGWLDIGSNFGPWSPEVSGGVASHYAVSPALPTGLSLDPTTGVLSGAAQVASVQTNYRISAQVGGTTANFDLILTVQTPPSGLSYSSPVQASVGTAFGPLTPVVSGDVDYYYFTPALPVGLQFDGATGVLSGTASSARPPATYTISASNNGGSWTTVDLSLAVGPPSPGVAATGAFRDLTVIGLGFVSGAHAGLTDAHGQFTYEGGQSIAFKVGNVGLGTVAVPKTLITPVDLIANGNSASNYVLNVVRFLMMLDQDGEPSNGIQISAAVNAAAASWAPVDFTTTDLPTALSSLIQQASTADGMTHALPDASSAQTRLRAEYSCNYAGRYSGFYTKNSAPTDHGSFTTEVYPDGSMHAIAAATATLAGFEVSTANALNPLLDASFALSSQTPSIAVQGFLTDPTYLSGTYLADAAGTFEAVGDAAPGTTYKFAGTYTRTPNDPAVSSSSGLVLLGMDDSNQVSGNIGGSLNGTVTGTTFVGTVSFYRGYGGYSGRGRTKVSYPVAGSFANTGTGYTLEGQYDTGQGGAMVKFATAGCRVN